MVSVGRSLPVLQFFCQIAFFDVSIDLHADSSACEIARVVCLDIQDAGCSNWGLSGSLICASITHCMSVSVCTSTVKLQNIYTCDHKFALFLSQIHNNSLSNKYGDTSTSTSTNENERNSKKQEYNNTNNNKRNSKKQEYNQHQHQED